MGASLSAERPQGTPLSGSNDFSLGQMAKSVHFSKEELKKMQSAFMAIAADSPNAGSTVITLEQFGRALNNVEVPAVDAHRCTRKEKKRRIVMKKRNSLQHMGCLWLDSRDIAD